jgi:hypothetical protein
LKFLRKESLKTFRKKSFLRKKREDFMPLLMGKKVSRGPKLKKINYAEPPIEKISHR